MCFISVRSHQRIPFYCFLLLCIVTGIILCCMYQQSQYRIVLIARYARQKDWNNLYVDHPYWCSIRNVCRYFYSHTKRLLRSFIVWQQVWTFYVGHHEACYTRPWIWTQTVSFVRKEILPYFIRNVCTVYKCKVNCKRPKDLIKGVCD